MEPRKPSLRRWLKVLVISLIGLLLIGLIATGIKSLTGGKSGKPRKPSTVTLLPDKPPPPPPPPKEEKRPEPPKDDKQQMKAVQNEQPQPAQNEPLKMEGAAGEGSSPFGSGTVGREYAGGAVGGTGSVGAAQSMYSGRLQRHLQDQLSRNRKLRESDYRVTVKIWLKRDGTIERAELAASTGSEKLDELLQESLQQSPPMREGPPENLVQPLKIRITNRGAA